MAVRVCPSCGYVIINPSQPCVSCGIMPGPEIPPAAEASAADPPIDESTAAVAAPVTVSNYQRAQPRRSRKSLLKRVVIVLGVLITLLIILLMFMEPADKPDMPLSVAWEKRFGGSARDNAISAQQTNDGGYVFVGMTFSDDGDVSGNHGSSDVWTVKLNASGEIEWQRCIGGSGDETAYSVKQANDGGYIVAAKSSSSDGDVSGNHGGHGGWWEQGDVWIVKLNPSGAIEWQKCFGGSGNEWPAEIQQTKDGGYIFTGSTDSNDGDVSGNHGDDDAWIVKLDLSGDMEWQRLIGGSDGDTAYSVKQTSDGGYVFAGVTNSNDGDVSGNHGDQDAWIIKLNAAGNTEWQKCLGGSVNEWASKNSIQQTKDGGYIVVGRANSKDGDVLPDLGTPGVWIVKLNTAGEIEWQSCLSDSRRYTPYVYFVDQRSDGGYILGGNMTSKGGSVSSAWIAKLNTSGVMEWQKYVGDPGEDWIESMNSAQPTKDGGYIVFGYTSSSSGDQMEAWIVKLSPDDKLGADDENVPFKDRTLPPHPLFGTWKRRISEEREHILVFYNDGTFDFKDVDSYGHGATYADIEYSIEGGRFTGDVEASSAVAKFASVEFEIRGNELLLSYANGEKETFINPDLKPQDAPADAPPSGTSSQNPLLGTWRTTDIQGNEVEVTYRSDGTTSSRTGGITMEGTYSVEGNRVTTVTPGIGRMVTTFEIKGDVCTEKPVYFEINGKDITSVVQSMTFTSTRVR